MRTLYANKQSGRSQQICVFCLVLRHETKNYASAFFPCCFPWNSLNKIESIFLVRFVKLYGGAKNCLSFFTSILIKRMLHQRGKMNLVYNSVFTFNVAFNWEVHKNLYLFYHSIYVSHRVNPPWKCVPSC